MNGPRAAVTPLGFDLDVACPPDHAFAVWSTRISDWWPLDHTVTGEPGLTVTFEPRVGGRLFERTAAGSEIDWGEVIEWEPPRRLGYLWHLNADRTDATEVRITFIEGAAGTTRVHIEHRGWERLGATAATRRDANLRGWAGLLPHFLAACSANTT